MISLEETFSMKMLRVGKSALGGVKSPDREDIQDVVEHGYRSDRKYENSPIDLLEMEMAEILEKVLKNNPNTNFASIPWSKHRFSKGWHLQVMVGFSDQHKEKVDEQIFPIEKARDFVDQVMSKSDELRRQLTIPEQFSIALDIAENSIVGAAIVAHAGSRAIAKKSDTRLSSVLHFREDEIKKWRDSVASFEAITGEYGAPPADTYHFWGTFLSGIVSTMHITGKDRFLNPVYRFLYTNMAEITEFLRYKLAGEGDGTVHKEADNLGYHLGSFLAEHIGVNTK